MNEAPAKTMRGLPDLIWEVRQWEVIKGCRRLSLPW